MRVLVVGGTRFIGQAVVHRLLSHGHEVLVFHRGNHEVDFGPKVRHIHDHRERLAEYQAELKAFKPDVALDTGLMTEHDAQVVCQALQGVVPRIVALSSMDVYLAYDRLHMRASSGLVPIPLREDAPLRTRLFPYRTDVLRPADDPAKWADDYDKILVERAVLGALGLQGTVLRLPMVYGPGDYHHRLYDLVRRMDDQRPAILLAEDIAQWRGSRGYISNVAEAVALAVTGEQTNGKIFNVADEQALSEVEWVQAVGNAAGWTGEIVIVPAGTLPSELTWAIDASQHWVADTRRIRTELGFREPVTLQEGLAATIAWERTEPPNRDQHASVSRDYEIEDAVLRACGFSFD